MTTLTDDLNALLELAAKVTDGEWKHVSHSWEESSVYTDQRDYPVCTAAINPDVDEDTQDVFEAEMDDNIKFIAAAKNFISQHGPALRELVERKEGI